MTWRGIFKFCCVLKNTKQCFFFFLVKQKNILLSAVAYCRIRTKWQALLRKLLMFVPHIFCEHVLCKLRRATLVFCKKCNVSSNLYFLFFLQKRFEKKLPILKICWPSAQKVCLHVCFCFHFFVAAQMFLKRNVFHELNFFQKETVFLQWSQSSASSRCFNGGGSFLFKDFLVETPPI